IKNPSFIKCYGISKNENGKYVLVLKYASMGSLRQNLQKISKMAWKNKLKLLLSISYDLKAIHSQDIVHRDLHSDNILQDDLHIAYIADLGLSIHYMKPDGEIYGVIPFVAPEVLEEKPYTTASDIYSFGIIMWEILYGVSSTSCFNQNQIFDIVTGSRPPVNKTDSNRYVDLMKKCWHQDPSIRPTADCLCEIFKLWRDNEQFISELNKFKLTNDFNFDKNSDINNFSISKLFSLDKNVQSLEQDLNILCIDKNVLSREQDLNILSTDKMD
ncbi:kinase-like domain-containing protein, partial [Gigaspora rosea]